MRTISSLKSAFHLIVVLMVLTMGAFFITIAIYPKLFLYFVDLLINNPQIILYTGGVIFSLGILLFICFYFIYKAQYLKFIMERKKTSVDTKLIENYIKKYFQNIYPEDKNDFQVSVDFKDKLEITTTVDVLEDQKEFLLNIEEKIGKLLSEHLDYQKEFIFTLKARK